MTILKKIARHFILRFISVCIKRPLRTIISGLVCYLPLAVLAQEKIVLKQNGENTTAMVQINYSGDPENFSLIFPVPSAPEIAIGDNRFIPELELATRPQFLLKTTGSKCPLDSSYSTDFFAFAENNSNPATELYNLNTKEIGPYISTAISRKDANAVNQWLAENGFNISYLEKEKLANYINMEISLLDS